MKWIAKRVLLNSNADMPASIPFVLINFVDKVKSEGKIKRWYSSLKTEIDGSNPSFRLYFEIEEQNEKLILDDLKGFLENNATQIGWTGEICPEPIAGPSYAHFNEINLACEFVLKLAKKYPNLHRDGNPDFWNEVNKEVSSHLSTMNESHHKEYKHFLANNFDMKDKDFISKLTNNT